MTMKEQVPEKVLSLCKILHQKGYQAWLVGGCVRDSLLGKDPNDWDIATDALPSKVSSLFPKVIETGIKHGTVTVVVDGEHFEITTFRGDGAYSDGRHPDSVTFVGSIDEDLSRRDFTINAIAYSPIQDSVCDPHHGADDLRKGIVRCVGDPQRRFAEDGLRILRAMRFFSMFDILDPDTESAISKCLDSYIKVAKERVREEWMKTMKVERPSRAFDVMVRTGVLALEAPEMMAMVGCVQNRYHGFDVWNHSLAVMDYCPQSDPLLRLTGILHDIGKPVTKGVNPKTGDATFYEHDVVGETMSRALLTGLKFSNEEIDTVAHLIRHHYIRYERGNSKVSIRRWVRRVGVKNLDRLFALARADILGKGPALVKVEMATLDELREKVSLMQVEEVIPTSTKVLKVNGEDVMRVMGIKPGPAVGSMLNTLLECVTEDPDLNTRETLLGRLEAMKPVEEIKP